MDARAPARVPAHERAHVQGHDNVWLLVARLAARNHWFDPRLG
ncbi:MAG: hypothetical protein R3F59_26955 [Myxococcota bacterium]